MASHLTRKRWIIINALFGLLLMATIVIALGIGSESTSLSDIFSDDARARAILFSSRLPRIILAALVGAALASAGGSYQALLRNPLADPFILGVSGGAALGSVIAVGLGLPFAIVSVAAFIGALVSMLGIYWVARTGGRLQPATLLLTGVIFNALCFALILFVNAVVPMEQAYEILTLLIGNLEATDSTTVIAVAAFVAVGLAILCTLSWKMNLLSLGDAEAQGLGVDLARIRAGTFIASSLMVGAAVAASGLIGFVGLFIPHIIRMWIGADHRLLIPASALFGAAFLIAADTAARTILMNTQYATQLPVGVITALVGAPMFIVLLKRRNSGVQ
jgi:ABC-type Fe3+-siderophore transport system permease subunit